MGRKVIANRFASFQWGAADTVLGSAPLSTPQNMQFASRSAAFCFEIPAGEEWAVSGFPRRNGWKELRQRRRHFACAKTGGPV